MVLPNVFRLLARSVDDVIDHYKKEQIVEGYTLKEAVSIQVGDMVNSRRVILFKWLAYQFSSRVACHFTVNLC